MKTELKDRMEIVMRRMSETEEGMRQLDLWITEGEKGMIQELYRRHYGYVPGDHGLAG